MKAYLLAHKKAILIGMAVLAAAALLLAVIITGQIKKPKGEPVPEGRIFDSGVFEDALEIHDSTKGEIVIEASTSSGKDSSGLIVLSAGEAPPLKLVPDPEQIWTVDPYAGNHTPVEQAAMADGSIGVLTIEKLKLSVNVFGSPDEMEDMRKGLAHFPSTSSWSGNIGLSGHNVNFDGTDGFFKNLHTLAEGDAMQYKTALGERTYLVESVKAIAASDWSPLGYEDKNQLTLITCISGKPDQRLCVRAVEKVFS